MSPVPASHWLCIEGEAVGGFTVEEDGALILFMARGAIKRWIGGEFTTIVEELPEERENRFNDVIADPVGRVLCGTMSTPQRKGRLYRLDLDGSLTVLLKGIGCSNGLASRSTASSCTTRIPSPERSMSSTTTWPPERWPIDGYL